MSKRKKQAHVQAGSVAESADAKGVEQDLAGDSVSLDSLSESLEAAALGQDYFTLSPVAGEPPQEGLDGPDRGKAEWNQAGVSEGEIKSQEGGGKQDTPQVFDVVSLEELISWVEAVLFLADKPLSQKQLAVMTRQPAASEQLSQALAHIQEHFTQAVRGIELVFVAGGYQFRTKPCHGERLQSMAKVQFQKLSVGAMETLAFIAYKQPVIKEEIDKIRGTDSSYFLRTLLERNLIKIAGRSELVGKPMLYATTDHFLEVFALKSLADLPGEREIAQMIPASEVRVHDPENEKLSQGVRDLYEAKHNVHYDPKQDEDLLKEHKKLVDAQKLTTSALEELDAQKAAKLAEAAQMGKESQ